jgi:lysophospholipase L1-like esterase
MQKFQTIIDQTKLKYHRTSLLISSILPWADASDSMNLRIELINSKLRDLCTQNKCHFVASYKVFLKKGKVEPGLYIDGLHLNIHGTKRLRQFFCQRLSEMGSKPTNPFSSAFYLRRAQWQGVSISNINY